MALQLVTAPATEPITTAEAKTQLRVTGSTDDDYIDGLVATVREYLDGRRGILGRALITQTWRLHMDEFPSGGIQLPRPPLISVSNVTYLDSDGNSQTLTVTDDYLVDIYSEPGWVVPAVNTSWPSTYDTINAVSVEFVCGYGAASDVPKPLIHAMKLLLSHYYENREATIVGTSVTDLPQGVQDLIANYREVAF